MIVDSINGYLLLIFLKNISISEIKEKIHSNMLHKIYEFI